MNELKPCPFGCAKVPAIDHSEMGWVVRCDSSNSHHDVAAFGDSEADAIAAWNARASSPDPAREALVVALKGYCAEHERHHCFLPYPHEKCPCELCKIATAALAEQGHK